MDFYKHLCTKLLVFIHKKVIDTFNGAESAYWNFNKNTYPICHAPIPETRAFQCLNVLAINRFGGNETRFLIHKVIQIEFIALARAVESSFVIAWHRAKELEVYDSDNELRDYAMALLSHVGLRNYFESKNKRYSATDAAFNMSPHYCAFGRAVREKLEYLEANSVPVPEIKAYVFWD